MLYYPKATKTCEIDLEELSEQIAYSSYLTQADCYAVIISLAAAFLKELEAVKIVRLGHLGAFQISVKEPQVLLRRKYRQKTLDLPR